MYINFEEAYLCMIRQAKFLTDVEAPIVYAGYRMAQTLDSQATPSTALLNEFGRTCRYIIAKAPTGTLDDELSTFLKSNMK